MGNGIEIQRDKVNGLRLTIVSNITENVVISFVSNFFQRKEGFKKKVSKSKSIEFTVLFMRGKTTDVYTHTISLIEIC